MSDADNGHVALSLVDVRVPNRLEPTSLRIHEGDCVVIVGANGAGKSTLLRVIAGLDSFEGSLEVFGRSELAPLERAAQIGWLPQRPLVPEGLTTEQLVATARFRFAEAEEQSVARARQTMEETGSQDLLGRWCLEISGGELQRVLISMLVAQQTPILLVDEPANHLDPRHQVASYRRLGKLWTEQRRTLVVVTHDVRLGQLLGPKEHVRVLGMDAGRIAFDVFLDDPKLPRRLADLYGVPFVSEGQKGALAVDLDGVEETEGATRT